MSNNKLSFQEKAVWDNATPEQRQHIFEVGDYKSNIMSAIADHFSTVVTHVSIDDSALIDVPLRAMADLTAQQIINSSDILWPSFFGAAWIKTLRTYIDCNRAKEQVTSVPWQLCSRRGIPNINM